MAQPILEVKDLQVHFPIRRGLLQRTVGHVKAVDGVSFTLNRGETLGLVGESGCGKTTAGRALLRLIPATGGTANFDGQDIFSLAPEAASADASASRTTPDKSFTSRAERSPSDCMRSSYALSLCASVDAPPRLPNRDSLVRLRSSTAAPLRI